MKTCTKCKIEKPFDSFGKDKEGKNGLKSRCKPCMIEYTNNYNKNNPEVSKKYRELNKDKINNYIKNYFENNKEQILEKAKEYYGENKDKFRDHHIIYKIENEDKIKQYRKQYYIDNKEDQIKKQINYIRKRRKTDILFKLKDNLRSRLYIALKRKAKNKSTFKYLGCSIEYFKNYLSLLFLPEFTWENHGIIWEIDHHIPCDSFDLSLEEDINKCFHYTNLKPRFKTTEIAESFGHFDHIGNRNKSNKIL